MYLPLLHTFKVSFTLFVSSNQSFISQLGCHVFIAACDTLVITHINHEEIVQLPQNPYFTCVHHLRISGIRLLRIPRP